MSQVKMLGTPDPRASIYHDHNRQAFVFTVGSEEVLSLAKDGEVKVRPRRLGRRVCRVPSWHSGVGVPQVQQPDCEPCAGRHRELDRRGGEMTLPPKKLVTTKDWEWRHRGHAVRSEVKEVGPKRMHYLICDGCGARHLAKMETMTAPSDHAKPVG